jgi:hypothetical protein
MIAAGDLDTATAVAELGRGTSRLARDLLADRLPADASSRRRTLAAHGPLVTRRHLRGRRELLGAEAELGVPEGGEEHLREPLPGRLADAHAPLLESQCNRLSATRAARSRSCP